MSTVHPGAAGAPAPAATAGRRSRRGKRRRSALRHRAELVLFRTAATGLAVLPRSIGRRALRGLTRVAFSFLKARRRILSANVAAAFPEKSEREIVDI
ncbi:MAG TPA: hypothetical protein VKS03_10915, partial [Thermoanaerobaculia bacterium]|nr:hypothetical protein [Thermoanaerobaculia bacterium]